VACAVEEQSAVVSDMAQTMHTSAQKIESVKGAVTRAAGLAAAALDKAGEVSDAAKI
jgi:hypothetical protein